MQYKIRILNANGRDKNFSLTIPKEIVKLIGSETMFFVEYNAVYKKIVFSSGTSIFPTEEQIKRFDMERLKI
jgi:hypothetical protein